MAHYGSLNTQLVSHDIHDVRGATVRGSIENAPQYDKRSLQSEDAWKNYEQAFKQYWEEEPVMHIKGSDRIITPPDEPLGASASSRSSAATSAREESGVSEERQVSAADLFPNRITEVFTDPAPGSGKVTLRPKSVARAEEAASGVTLLKPRWWESFENYLRLNKDDIQAECAQCKSKAA